MDGIHKSCGRPTETLLEAYRNLLRWRASYGRPTEISRSHGLAGFWILGNTEMKQVRSSHERHGKGFIEMRETVCKKEREDLEKRARVAREVRV